MPKVTSTKSTAVPPVPAAKPTSPPPPPVAVPPPPMGVEEPTPVIETLIPAEVERVSKPHEAPAVTALRELLAAAPVDVSTCAEVNPEKLKRYIEARAKAAAVLGG